jgi:uncharacterized protein YdbL (DUF1318 family)
MRLHQLAAGCLMLALLVASPALALGLDEARNAGLIGEQPNGYVGIVVANPDAAVKDLAAKVNTKRKAHYQRIAEENGTKVAAVAARAGEKLIADAPSGQFVKRGGKWVKKP